MIRRLNGSEKVTAQRINELIDDVERQTRISIGPGLTGSTTSAGTAIAAGTCDPFPWRPDTDATAIMGRAAVGWNGAGGGSLGDAFFAHLDHMDIDSYALRQNELGYTVLNFHTGTSIILSVDNALKVQLNATDLRYVYNADGVAYFGRAAIGYDGTNADEACFAHLDEMNSNDFALRQESAGDTTVNCVESKQIKFTHHNSLSYVDMFGGLTVLHVDSAETGQRAALFSNNFNGPDSVVKIVQDLSAGAGLPCLLLDQDDISEGFIDFVGAAGAAINTHLGPSTGSILIEVNGVVRSLAYW